MPLKKALQWIIFSTVLISGTPALGLLYYKYHKSRRSSDDKYRIVAIAQTSSQKEALKTVYLAELLDLSIDKPRNLYQFDSSEAQKMLQSSPLIKRALIRKITPGTLYIDYDLRLPIAYFGDLTNTAIDEEGVIFPFKPFFTPKRLPELIIGLEDAPTPLWGTKLQGQKVELGLQLLDLLQRHCCLENTFVKKVDVSNAFALSNGQREIVIIFERNAEGKGALLQFQRILRLSPEHFPQELANYLALSEHLVKQEADPGEHKPLIVDLRIPHLAYIKR